MTRAGPRSPTDIVFGRTAAHCGGVGRWLTQPPRARRPLAESHPGRCELQAFRVHDVEHTSLPAGATWRTSPPRPGARPRAGWTRTRLNASTLVVDPGVKSLAGGTAGGVRDSLRAFACACPDQTVHTPARNCAGSERARARRPAPAVNELGLPVAPTGYPRPTRGVAVRSRGWASALASRWWWPAFAVQGRNARGEQTLADGRTGGGSPPVVPCHPPGTRATSYFPGARVACRTSSPEALGSVLCAAATRVDPAVSGHGGRLGGQLRWCGWT